MKLVLQLELISNQAHSSKKFFSKKYQGAPSSIKGGPSTFFEKNFFQKSIKGGPSTLFRKKIFEKLQQKFEKIFPFTAIHASNRTTTTITMMTTMTSMRTKVSRGDQALFLKTIFSKKYQGGTKHFFRKKFFPSSTLIVMGFQWMYSTGKALDGVVR